MSSEAYEAFVISQVNAISTRLPEKSFASLFSALHILNNHHRRLPVPAPFDRLLNGGPGVEFRHLMIITFFLLFSSTVAYCATCSRFFFFALLFMHFFESTLTSHPMML